MEMETDILTIPAQIIRGSRFSGEHMLHELEFDSKKVSKFVFASIKGHVKWKRGPGTVLRLRFYKRGKDLPDAELQLAKTDKVFKADDEYVTTYIDFEYDERHEYCIPRQRGWSRISSLLLFSPPDSFHTQPRGCDDVVNARAT